uniref:Uncharacterized protein n=1 Tax=viral metagenome TaxID=1070528 RepID=A0A6C0KIZ6_9ZZZZ
MFKIVILYLLIFVILICSFQKIIEPIDNLIVFDNSGVQLALNSTMTTINDSLTDISNNLGDLYTTISENG